MIPNDSIDFYPTPDFLAGKMLDGIGHDMKYISYSQVLADTAILEPSAGDGAICKVIKERGGNPDCVELSEDFRAVLKQKEFRVVHDNFLTFRPCKKYDAIIMNPPFSQGAAHLLKALEIQQRGGKIRCLLNAETIRNPCTNERKELVQLLQKYGAQIEYIKDAFKSASRKTNVEVALVSVDIPEAPPVSRIRLELKQETTARLAENPELAALVSSDPITAAIERYNAAAEGLRRFYEEYNGIASLLESTAAGGDGKASEGIQAHVTELKPCSYNKALKVLRAKYWHQLFDLPQIRDALTNSAYNEYISRVQELANYDFSAYNILTVREEISRNVVASIDAEIIKLFDDWTNLHYNEEYSKNIHYFNGWCTNSAYKIGKRVIFRCNAYTDYGYRYGREFRAYNVRDKIANIEKVLHYLDTNGKTYNSGDLWNALQQAEKTGETQKVKFRYFYATFYKKGTCHIEFTDMDTLKRFNMYACQRKGWLPPSYGKKAYKDMDKGSQKVVDSFEGKDSYNDTMTRHLVPTKQSLLQIAQ